MEHEEPESFEKSMSRLEEIVAELEKGDLSLDESLRRYEEGIRALRHCEGILKKAEQTIQVLLKDEEGNLKETPFDASAAGPEAASPLRPEASAPSAGTVPKRGRRPRREEDKDDSKQPEPSGSEDDDGIPF
ncbi:MAG: exodeoxyribonuclease VII small subunit [Planctomycetes bacterium]|nr:exodeoxyribonuclease VII small subunit [Planctomycetota bacterium]